MCCVSDNSTRSVDGDGAWCGLVRLIGILLVAVLLTAAPLHAAGRGNHRAAGAAAATSLNAVNGALEAAASGNVPGGSTGKPQEKPQSLGLRLDTAGTDILALGARASTAGATSFLSIDLSAPVTATAFVLAEPDRIIVELPDTRFHMDDSTGRLAHAEGLIKSFRFGQFATGRSRLVIDLAGPARIVKIASERLAAGDPARLVIGLVAETPANFAAAAARASLAEAKANLRRRPAVAKLAGPPRQVIVIDPGHGGMDSGAAGQA